MPNPTLHIRAQIIDQYGRPLPGAKVALWHWRGKKAHNLRTSTRTDEAGIFEFVRERQEGDSARTWQDRYQRVFFVVYWKNRKIADTRERSIWSPPLEGREMTIPVELPEKKYFVKGTVTNADQSGFQGMVRVFDIDERGETRLGETTTHSDGTYRLQFPESLFARGGKYQPDLQVRVYNEIAGANLQVGQSEVMPNAKEQTTIDLQLKEAKADTAARNRIVPALKVCNKGTNVADLHAALVFLEYQLLEKEVQGQLFGRTTRAAVRQFQEWQELPVTGIVDDKTAKHLNETLEKKGYFQVEASPLPATLLQLKAQHLDEIEEEPARTFIQDRMQGRLFELILATFKDPSEPLSQAVLKMEPDLKEWADKTLSQVICDEVLPYLMDIPALAAELDALEEGFYENAPPGTIRELLHLDRPIKDHPFFRDEARRARNAELGNMIGLDADKMAVIADLHLDTLNEETWKRLVEARKLTTDDREELELTIEFAKLSDDNFPLIRTLRGKKVRHTRELVEMDRSDWKELFEEHQIEAPEEDDLDSYADNIVTNIEQTYPTRFFLHRTVERDQSPRVAKVRDLAPVFRQQEVDERGRIKLFDNGSFNHLNWKGISKNRREKLTASLADLEDFSRTYKHLGVATILEEKDTPILEKEKKIEERLALLRKFNDNNPELNLGFAHLYLTGEDVPEELKPSLRGLRRKQDQEMVLRQMRGFQRVMNLAEETEKKVVLLARGFDSAVAIARLSEDRFREVTGFTEEVTGSVYYRALKIAGRSSHAMAVMHENFGNLYHYGGLKRLLRSNKTIFQDIPGYDELFGSQNYCSCSHCRSIFSPAAYFVDLMEFVKEKVLNTQFKFCPTHPIHLKTRRPDLWTLPLTCENTDTMIPYLEIVVQVMRDYLKKKAGVNNPFRLLSRSDWSLDQPFNLPLERLRLYLQHFRVELADIYELTGKKKWKVARERLGFSPKAFTLLTDTSDTKAKKRFGEDFLQSKLVREFMKSTGLNREEVDELLACRSIPRMKNIKVKSIIGEPGSQDADDIFETLGQGLEEKMTGVRNKIYFDLYFFLRVWRATPWKIGELDLVFSHLKPYSSATESSLQNDLVVISDLLRIQDRLELSVEQTVVLFHQMPAEGENSLFRRLFGELSDLDQAIELESLGEQHFTFAERADIFAGIQSALGITAVELQRLVGYLKEENESAIEFTLEALTAAYRYAKVARGLELSVHQLIFIETHLLGRAGDLGTAKMKEATDHIFALIEAVEVIDSLPFSVDELAFLLTGIPLGQVNYAFGLEVLRSLVEQLFTDSAIYFSTEKLAETGSISTDDSRAIVERLAEVGLLVSNRVYRLKDQYAVLEDAIYDSIRDHVNASNPALGNKLGTHRDVIINLLESNRRQIQPGMLVRIEGGIFSTEESAAFIQAMNTHDPDVEMLVVVAEVFRLSENWVPTEVDLLLPLVEEFQLLASELEDNDSGEVNRFTYLADLVIEKTGVIREILNPYHTPIPAQVGSLLGVSQERFDAIAGLLNLPPDDSFIYNLEALQLAGEQPFTIGEGLSAILEPIQQIERIQLLTERLNLDEIALSFINNNRELLNYDEESLLFNWKSVQALFTYSELLKNKDAEERQQVNGLMKKWTGEQIEELAHLMGTSPIQFLPMDLDLSLLEVVKFQQRVLDLRQLLQIDGKALEKLSADTYKGLTEAANIALNTIKAKYEEKALEKVLEPIEGRLRSRMRDALVDYLLSRRDEFQFKDAHELTHYFLIDVSMEGCARISKIKAAILSLQLYVHYYRIGLEKSPVPCMQYYPYPGHPDPQLIPHPITTNFYKIKDEEWLWRKNYRVWEANRRVFTYPECYIEPDLRDNKTELFKEFESLLFQKDAGKMEVVEEGYSFYLKKMTEIADLKFMDGYFDEKVEIYYLIGRTKTKPYQFYWATFKKPYDFSEWKLLDIDINSSRVSPVVFQKNLFLFWVETHLVGNEETESKLSYRVTIDVNLNYSKFDETGEWERPIKMDGFFKAVFTKDKDEFDSFFQNLENERWYHKCYPNNKNDKSLVVSYYFDHLMASKPGPDWYRDYASQKVVFFDNRLEETNRITIQCPDVFLKITSDKFINLRLATSQTEAELNEQPSGIGYHRYLSNEFSNITPYPETHFISNNLEDSLIQFKKQYFLTIFQRIPNVINTAIVIKMRRLTTSLAKDLGKTFRNGGLDRLLSYANQSKREKPINFPISEGSSDVMLLPGNEPSVGPNFWSTGAFRHYFRELYFHIPFLIANHLNSTQKFEKADYWYRKIFDPTISDVWRYIEFRNKTIPSLYDMLSDSDAMEVSESDPFNPHAIARLRLSAYMKNIVMKYIDNLLDWGDKLFARDTFESINEALMLYILASDVLGERPYKLGNCETADQYSITPLNYTQIESKGRVSGALIEVENIIYSNLGATLYPYRLITGRVNDNSTQPGNLVPAGLGLSGGTPNLGSFVSSQPRLSIMASPARRKVSSYLTVKRRAGTKANNLITRDRPTQVALSRAANLNLYLTTEEDAPNQPTRRLAFCVPPNDCLLDYWDRVEDRLFKIRNCMNIEGVERQLSLFEPRIDPMLLVRARAAGLSLEDILDMLSAKPPAYRFNYILEKAKSFVQTVQSLGANLLSALEKKDAEELVLLRSVHEQELLDQVKAVKKHTIEEAKANYIALEKSIETVNVRVEYYKSRFEEAKQTGSEVDTAHNKREQDALSQQENAKSKQRKASDFDYDASIINAIGSDRIGFRADREGFTTYLDFSFGTDNAAAATTAKANKERRSSTMSSLSSSLTSTRNSYHRRKQEWELQKTLAEKEKTQLEQQLIVAEVRRTIAEKDLEAHQKQIAQSQELYDLYKDKFSNLGLYTYLSTELSRLYRQAYNMALDLARQAERAYHFEREQTYFIKNDNWSPSRSGLLAGERLLLQLQQMEKAYMEKNLRDYEINQSFSLLQLAPEALIHLKGAGDCAFRLREAAFDLVYPGYYQRRIKSVRLTIPCVTGPYTNVSCKLSLQGSEIRTNPTMNEGLFEAPKTLTTSIATSTAQNDGGVFELNFRDERYLPFEGAGAISEWTLSMPETFRAFDYNSISDVVLHISYTAKFDGGLRSAVQRDLEAQLNAMTSVEDAGPARLFSLKHDFSNAFHALLRTDQRPVTFDVDQRHFPMWFMGRNKLISDVEVHAVLKPGENIEEGFSLVVRGQEVSFPPPDDDEHTHYARFILGQGGSFSAEEAEGTWTIEHDATSHGELPAGAIENILILVRYTIGQ